MKCVDCGKTIRPNLIPPTFLFRWWYWTRPGWSIYYDAGVEVLKEKTGSEDGDKVCNRCFKKFLDDGVKRIRNGEHDTEFCESCGKYFGAERGGQ